MTPPFPPGTFELIYADPPLHFDSWGITTGQGKSPSRHYSTMTVDAVCRLPVAEIAAPNSILACWCYTPRLADTLRIMEAWGFPYVTLAVWDKDCFGTGYYFRAGAELLFLGKRGKGLKVLDRAVRQVFRERRREHSRKPEAAYEALERLFGPVSRLELFARHRRLGWAAWGDELPPFEGEHEALAAD